MQISDLPTVNAVLNTISAVFLSYGYVQILRRNITKHRFCMVAATITSVLFLISYLIYHFEVGSKKFAGTGTVRQIYLAILASHTVLAAFVPFLAIITLSRAIRNRIDQHRKIARWALPIWLYVSITGVIVYWMLYRVKWG